MNNLSTTFRTPRGRVLQGNNLGYKERRQSLTTIKAPIPPHIKVRIIYPSLALQSCENISNLTFGGYLAGSTPAPSARCSCFLLLQVTVRAQGSCFSLVRFTASSGIIYFTLQRNIIQAKGLVAELTLPHIQSVQVFRGERVRVVGLTACCYYL